MLSWDREEILAHLLKSEPDKLIPMIAFDLRSKVASIMGSAKLLREESSDLKDKDREYIFGLIESHSQDIMNLLLAMSDYDRVRRDAADSTK